MKENIFKNKSVSWGLRGDPLFWKYLEDRFPSENISNPEQLVDFIQNQHELLTNEKLNISSTAFSKELSLGSGLSDGRISGEFWLNTAIPLLISRLK